MKKTILLFGLVLGFLSVNAIAPDHHEGESECTKTESVEKKCDKSEKKCAEYKEECKERKSKCHKGERYGKCGDRGGCGKGMCFGLTLLLAAGIGYFCGKKCGGKCNCCCKKE